MRGRMNRISKPRISLAQIDKVMQGQKSVDPVLVINSMDVPTMSVQVACLAGGRGLPYMTKNYEEILYILEGKGSVYLQEGGKEQRYEFTDDDAIFVPANVPSKFLNGSGFTNLIGGPINGGRSVHFR